MAPPQTQVLENPTTPAAAADAFAGKALVDAAGFMATVSAALGDRLGLFRDLAACGPQTAQEIADCTKTSERYVREWANGMVAAGYLTFDAATAKYAFPAGAADVLAQEGGPHFFGGVYMQSMGAMAIYEKLVDAFRTGGGVPQSAYPTTLYDGMDRFTAGWHENLLRQQWIPASPTAQKKLQAGARVADVGCGRGRAIVRLAQAYPRSTFVGFDVYAPNIEAARAFAKEAGVADRVRFEVRDVSTGLPGQYDVITTFDVIHDAVDPQGLLTTIRKALAPGGVYLNLDINCSDDPHGNNGPLGTVFYGFSLLYCMTTSLAHGGAGLGTVGLSPRVLESLAKTAGFRSVRKIGPDDPFNNLYELNI